MAEQQHATKRDVDAWFNQKSNVMRLRRCARCLGADAEDTIHTTYTYAVTGIHRLRERDSLGAWIHGIHRNILLSHWRRVRRTGVLPIDHDLSEEPSDEEPSDEDLIEEILRFGETLPSRQRHALEGILRGETVEETAHRLGLTIHKVNYARGKLFAALSKRRPSLLWGGVPVRVWFPSVVGKLGIGKLVLGLIVITGLSLAVTSAVTDPDAPAPNSFEPTKNEPTKTEPPVVVHPSKETSLKLVGDIRELQKAGKHREALRKLKRLTHPEFRKTQAEHQIGSHCALGEREAARKLAETHSLPNPCD